MTLWPTCTTFSKRETTSRLSWQIAHLMTTNQMIYSAARSSEKFEIMGEALTRIRKDDEQVLTKIRDHRDIISFRNILIHGYDTIDNRIVWGVIQEDLDNLIEDVSALRP